MNMALWLQRAGLAARETPAIAFGPSTFANYGAFADRVARLAYGLVYSLNCKPGDRVGIVSKNSPLYLECLYAIWHAGLAAVPINAKLHGSEIAWILSNSGCDVAFCSADMSDEVARHQPSSLKRLIETGTADYEGLFSDFAIDVVARAPSDLAWLFYTSGTTGRPKGAMLTHGNLLAATYAYLSEVDATHPGDSLLHSAPMSHGSGCYIMAVIARQALNIIPESGRFDPPEIFDLFRHYRRISMFAAPTMIKRLTQCPMDLDPSAIRTIIWGGAPMHVADTIEALDRFGPVFAQIYGQGESPMTITTLSKQMIGDSDHPRWRDRLATAGLPYANMEVSVVDANGKSVATGKSGEIICKGKPVMPGYWQNPDATSSALQDGWLYTGDVGAFDEEGFLSLKDRSKDVIITGGSNVYPREVEEVLLKHKSVSEASVIGRADAEWGEIIVAYFVGDAEPAELDALCLQSIARFKRPKAFIRVEALPKNNYGKILKTELREMDLKNEKVLA